MGWVGATMGMSSSFFVGPIAKKIGGSGDIVGCFVTLVALTTLFLMSLISIRAGKWLCCWAVSPISHYVSSRRSIGDIDMEVHGRCYYVLRLDIRPDFSDFNV